MGHGSLKHKGDLLKDNIWVVHKVTRKDEGPDLKDGEDGSLHPSQNHGPELAGWHH